jgi:4-alpha-glucanotransferase
MFLHITSLPSPYGIGSLGKEAFDFVDFLSDSGQKIWQILPLGHIGSGAYYSPYTTFSAFAGNPLLIDIDFLINDGYIEKNDLYGLDFGDVNFVDYQKVEKTRGILFRKAFNNHSKIINSNDFEDFIRQNSYWLNDYAHFMVNKFTDEAKYFEFLQYLFFKQWYALKEYANKKNIKIFGDILFMFRKIAQIYCTIASFY